MTAAISIIELKPPAVRAVTAFDYGALAPDVAAEIRRQATQIKSKITKTTQDLIVIGRDLEAVKERLDHGQFTTWVESELGIVVRTAQLYMAVARLAKDKGESISLLPSPTVHRLAAKSTPPEVVFKPAERDELGDTDQTKWETDATGKPRDPWSQQQYVPLENAETGELLTFVTASQGGKSAIGRLVTQFLRNCHNGLPVVRLATSSYKHKSFGRVEVPDFPIVRWIGSGGASTEPQLKVINGPAGVHL